MTLDVRTHIIDVSSTCTLLETQLRLWLVEAEHRQFLLQPSNDDVFFFSLHALEEASHRHAQSLLPSNVAFAATLASWMQTSGAVYVDRLAIGWAAVTVDRLLGSLTVDVPPLWPRDEQPLSYTCWSSVVASDIVHAQWLLARMDNSLQSVMHFARYRTAVDCLEHLQWLIVRLRECDPRNAAVHFAVIMGVSPSPTALPMSLLR